MPPAKRSSSAGTKTSFEVFFDFERDPGKSAVRYTEAVSNGGDEQIGKLYLKRKLFEKLGKPEALKVTVEPDEES